MRIFDYDCRNHLYRANYIDQLHRGKAIFTGTKFVNYNGQYFIWVENLVVWIKEKIGKIRFQILREKKKCYFVDRGNIRVSN